MKRLYALTIIAMTMTISHLQAGGGIVAREVIEEAPTDNSPWYIGAGLARAKFAACKNECTYEDVTYGVMLRGGYEFNRYLGVELRAMRSLWKEGPFGGVPLQHIGIYAKPQYPLSDRLNIYALLGYGYTENLGNGARLNYFDDDSGFSAGIGLEYDLSDKDGDFESTASYDRIFDGHADQGKGWSLYVDYQRLLIKSDVPDMDVVSLGLRYDF